MKRLPFAAVLAWFLITYSPTPVAAQDEERADAAERRCVSLTAIARTRIVDDRTILFYMRDGTIYRNDLTHACPGLSREGKFMYRVAAHQLCNVDTISVLEDYGFAYVQGPACGLGPFTPVSRPEADELLSLPDR